MKGVQLTFSNKEYPCVYGFFDYKKVLSDLNFINQSPIYKDINNRIFIWRDGNSAEFHTCANNNKTILLVGRVYEPYRIFPGYDQDVLKLIGAGENEFAKIDGNFILINISNVSGKNNLFLCNDKFGSRLILYMDHKGVFYFSTHLIGLKKLLSNKLPEIDNESLIHFYHFRQTCNNSTLLKNVKKLEPGYSLKISNDGFQLIKYFDVLSYFNCDFNFDFKYTVQNINELLEKSINNRMSNDKDKLGLTISGGLDSGFIAKLLHKNKIDFTGFNLGYKDLYNEYKRLNQLRKFYQLNINKIIIDFDSIINSIEFANKFTSEPCGVNDAILTNIWRSAEEEGITTMFEGGGADHLFFGMNRYRGYFNLWKTYQKFPNIVYLNKFEKIFEKIQIKNLSKIQFLIKNWENGIPPYPKRKIGEVYFYNLNMERSIFELGIKKYYDNFINALGYFDLRKYFSYQTILMDPEEHFYPPSELQAIYNIFPISPYWKSDLVRLALQIPMEWKTKLFKTKYILRKSAQYYKVNKSENNNYWMKSKIGLQSPMNFIHKNSMAKEWLAALSKQILDSKEYQIIKDFNGEYPTSPERLLSFLIWNKNNPEIGLFDIT